jgi:DNA-binding winged helix-turn-helix (wHTH) protein
LQKHVPQKASCLRDHASYPHRDKNLSLLLARYGKMPPASYRFSDFHLVPSRRSLYRDSKPVDLKPKTLDVLLTLVERHHRAVPQSELYEVVWPTVHIGQQNIRTHIYDLRRVLGHKSISTIPGVGYKFALDVTAEGKQQPAEVPYAPPNRPKTNLRHSLTPAIGRESEIRQLGEEIAISRLVTLSGTSGIGKTTLAVELGHNVLHDFPDGIWLIDLSPISNPTLVISAVARVLDIRLQTEESSLESWPGESGQGDKWSFCLTAAKMAADQESR